MVRKIIIFGALIALATCAVASGIRVSPGAFCAQNIDIGRDLDLGVDLTIDNNSDSRQSFCVSPIKPSQAKASWLKGYSEIPDPNWLYFSDSRIEVEPRSSGRVRMKLKIPNDKKYLNQRWIVFVNIANEIKNGEMLGVSIKPNYMFETRSDKINVRPAGIIGFNPSNINVAASPGKSQTVSFTLFNNDKKNHSFKIVSFLPSAASSNQEINLSPGYEWSESKEWLKPLNNTVKIGAGQKKEIGLKITIPGHIVTSTKGWESLVFIESDSGECGFIRVLVDKKIG